MIMSSSLDLKNKKTPIDTETAMDSNTTRQDRQLHDNCSINEHKNPLSPSSASTEDRARDQQESRKAMGCEMENTIQVAAEFATDDVQAMSRDEALHHTVNLMLFCLGVTSLCIGPDVTAATPFSGMFLLIPALTALIAVPTLIPAVNISRWFQRGAIAAIYATILVQQVPADTSITATSLFTIVAATSFLAPTVIRLSKATRVLAAVVVAGLVVAGLVV